MKKWIGKAKVTDGQSWAETIISLEERPRGERSMKTHGGDPEEQPQRGQNAGAVSGLFFASKKKCDSMEGWSLCIEKTAGNAAPTDFAIAACLAFWHAFDESIPADFDFENWKEAEPTAAADS